MSHAQSCVCCLEVKVWHLTSSKILQTLVGSENTPLIKGGGEGAEKTKATRAKWRRLGIGEIMRLVEGSCCRRGISVPKAKDKQALGLRGRQSCRVSFPAAVMH